MRNFRGSQRGALHPATSVRWLLRLACAAVIATALFAADAVRFAGDVPVSDAHVVAGEFSLHATAPAIVPVGNTFVVDVGNVHNGAILYQAVQWHLNYDESLVSFVSATAYGPFPLCSSQNDNGVRLLLGCIDLGGPNLTYNGDLWQTTFQCNVPGLASFVLVTVGSPNSFVSDGSTDQPIHTHDVTVLCGGPFTVSSTGDGGDSNAADDICNDGSGQCTLRAAIEQANVTAGIQTISFAIAGTGPHTIAPATVLPNITDSITIDGTTEPDYDGTPVVVIDGSSLPGGTRGIKLLDGDNTVTGLSVTGFPGDAIYLNGGTNSAIRSNIIDGNGGTGVHLVGASANSIGGSSLSGQGNTIINNGVDGIIIEGASSTLNQVFGNFIGTDFQMVTALPNGANGVHFMDGASNNAIGDVTAGLGNVIAYNAGDGVQYESFTAINNTVRGNAIYSNGDKGIDLNGAGAMSQPIISSATATAITGTACFFCTVDIYSDSVNEGRIYRGTTTANGGGAWSFSGYATGPFVTASAYLSGANTSRFSAAVALGYTVNSTNDIDDLTCNVAHCSLREAMLAANADGVESIIQVDSGTGFIQIAPGSALPTMSGVTDIDGTTQIGYLGAPFVAVDGAGAGAGVDGFKVAGGILQGFVINNFGGDAVETVADGNVIVNNFIGTDETGTIDEGNAGQGVRITSDNNTVGGTSWGLRNLISGNTNRGVDILGTGSGNLIQGNLIGTDITGTAAIPNTLLGVQVLGPGNTIGGALGGNLISGNGGAGVVVSGLGAIGNTIAGNAIGVNLDGTADLGNGGEGVVVQSNAANTIVGGVTAVLRNLISGNNDYGVRVSAVGAGNVVLGNFIGTDATGNAAIGNTNDGVRVDSATGVTIGGSTGTTPGGACTGACNLISGNGWGIVITSTPAGGSTVIGNFIGTDVTGTADLGNASTGLTVSFSDDNVIGGTSASERNVISGNTNGVEVILADNTVIQGNYIGTTSAGTAALGNSSYGVAVGGTATLTTIGGTLPGSGNVISGNGYIGLQIAGDDNDVLGNRIGTNAAGTATLGNSSHGMLIFTGDGNVIGNVTGGGNTITGNGGDGVRVDGGTGNPIRGNRIYGNTAAEIDNVNGGNGELAAPFGIVAGNEVTGSACFSCEIDIYSADGTSEGRVFQGSTTAGLTGDWSFSGALAGPDVTATATDGSGNTSEFSGPVPLVIELLAGSPGTPGFGGEGVPANTPGVLLSGPHGLFETPGGDLYFADSGNDRIRVISPNSPTGIISTYAGGGAGTCGSGAVGDGGQATSARLCSPADVFVHATGDVYIADAGNCRVRKVDAFSQVITTIAGTGACGFSGDNGAATSAQVNNPRGVAVDGAGNVYIADTDNHRIRKIDATGSISTVAGTGTAGFSGDNGPALAARLNRPHDVYLSTGGSFVIADTDNHRVRRVGTVNGIIGTIAGTGVAGYNGDDVSAVTAQLSAPEALAVDASGDVFVADTQNNRIRMVSFNSGNISTVIGTGASGSGGDGGPPESAQLNLPAGVALGSLVVADTGNHTLRAVESNIDPATGEPRSGFAKVTACSVALGSVATADWLLPLVPLGLILGRRRLGRVFALLGPRGHRAAA